MMILRFGMHWRQRFTACALLVAALLCLSGCTSDKPPPIDLARVRQFEAQGYPAPHDFDTDEAEEVRLINGQPAHLVWCRPRDAEAHPLLIYMPGVGQSAHAFKHGRHALAQAGYVVLSWQPLPEDEAAQTSRRYATAALQRRSGLLARLRADLIMSQSQGDPRLRHVNLSRIGLIGFDLGAYTVMHAAGEAISGAAPEAGLSPFQAYVVISPYASFEQGAFDTRYKAMSAPILTLTSDSDVDPDGGMPAAYLRTVPFGNMPVGDKYMLLMQSARHATLGEQNDSDDARAVPEGERDKRHGQQSDASHQAGRSSRGRSKGMHSGDTSTGTNAADARGRSPTSIAMQRSALIAVSTAFLDAYLQDDTLARQWLRSQAGKWLTPIGDWKIK